MMAKTQITLESEMQRRARQRANDLGVSLAEYFRRLLARDLARPETAAEAIVLGWWSSGLLTGRPAELGEQFAGLLWRGLLVSLLLGVAERPRRQKIAQRARDAAAALLQLDATA